MTKSALKKERINIYMDINQLKELVKEKRFLTVRRPHKKSYKP